MLTRKGVKSAGLVCDKISHPRKIQDWSQILIVIPDLEIASELATRLEKEPWFPWWHVYHPYYIYIYIFFVCTLCNCMVSWYVSVEPSSTSIDHLNLRHRIDSRPCEMYHFAQSASRRRLSTLLCPWTQPDKLRKASPGGPTLENVDLGLGIWTCRMACQRKKYQKWTSAQMSGGTFSQFLTPVIRREGGNLEYSYPSKSFTSNH